MPSNFFSKTVQKQNGRKAQNVMANLMAYSVVACYGILGLLVFGSILLPNTFSIGDLYEQIFMILVMTIGAFLALAKDIFSPRREITIQEVMDLAKILSGNNNVNPEETTPEPENKPEANAT